MGGFLTVAGIASAKLSDTESAMRTYAAAERGKFTRARMDIGDPDVAFTPGDNGRLSVLCPNGYENCSKMAGFLSKTLKSPVFLFHVHDGDFWMYSLFVAGKEVDHFNPIPDYWPGDCSTRDRKRCAGNPRVLAKHWPGLTPKMVKPYLVTWDLTDEDPPKAHGDDIYPYNDCMQLVDFMRRLGLKFPLDDDEQPVGKFYRFDVPNDTMT